MVAECGEALALDLIVQGAELFECSVHGDGRIVHLGKEVVLHTGFLLEEVVVRGVVVEPEPDAAPQLLVGLEGEGFQDTLRGWACALVFLKEPCLDGTAFVGHARLDQLDGVLHDLVHDYVLCTSFVHCHTQPTS